MSELKPTYDPTPFPSDADHVSGLIPGNNRPKAGKPSYEELGAIVCGLEGERTATKRRVVSAEMLTEFAAMGGKVVKDRGEIVVLCDFGAVRVHYGSS